jgi:DNA-binding NarL/FixJ family response regulator
MKKILIVEDHPFVAQATKELLETWDIDHAEICKNAEDAMIQLNAHRDWFRIWLDINVPGATGLSLIRFVHQLGFASKASIITAIDNHQWCAEIEDMGFLGYILKSASVEEFNQAVSEIMEGHTYFITSKNTLPSVSLTLRQTEILGLLHEGMCTKKIANHLELSLGTVNNHIGNLISALSANDRTHAVALGMKYGYIKSM